MRNISFALTAPQIIEGSKTVTRRLGWERLQAGALLRPIRKGQGLKKGEKVEVLRGPIRVVSVRRERLDRMVFEPDYGYEEVRKEGFPDDDPSSFVEFFCKANRPCEMSWLVTRIEFEYQDAGRCLVEPVGGKVGDHPRCAQYPDCPCGGPQPESSAGSIGENHEREG